MKSLDDIIEKAITKKTIWGEDAFISILRKLESSYKGLSYYWDDEAGENWATVLQNEDIIAIICHDLPITFLKESYIEMFSSLLELKDLEIEISKDFDIPEWTLKSSQNQFAIGWHADKEAVNPEKFSVNDLKYATI